MITETLLSIVVTAVACALPGCWLVLRRMAMMSDAISHVLLPGIVLSWLVVGDLDSPWLLVGAAATAMLTVALVELLQKTRLIREDAAIGLVFPGLFALGVLLASVYLRNTHLDVDRVMLGIPEQAWRRRMTIGATDIGPWSLAVMSIVLTANVVVLTFLHNPLKLATFDATGATLAGLRPGLIHYGLMTMVSLTGVCAFDAAGPVLMVAFFVVPAMTAWLVSERVSTMLMFAGAFAATGGIAGVGLAVWTGSTMSGCVAVMLGAQFGLVFAGSEIAGAIRRRRARNGTSADRSG